MTIEEAINWLSTLPKDAILYDRGDGVPFVYELSGIDEIGVVVEGNHLWKDYSAKLEFNSKYLNTLERRKGYAFN